jgi:hypothetical protein
VFEQVHCQTVIMLCNRSATSDNFIEALRSGRLSAAALDVLGVVEAALRQLHSRRIAIRP